MRALFLVVVLAGSCMWGASAAPEPAPATDNGVVLWNIRTHAPRLVLRGHTQPITSVVWGASGRSLATGSEDAVMLWDAETGKRRAVMTGAALPIAWNPKQDLIATGSGGSTQCRFLVWNAATGKRVGAVPLPKPNQEVGGYPYLFANLEWSPDGTQLAAAMNWEEAHLWNPKIPTHLTRLPKSGAPFAWRPNEGILATSGGNGALIWKTKPVKQIGRLAASGRSGQLTSLEWSSDGKRIALTSFILSSDPFPVIWILSPSPKRCMLLTGDAQGVAWKPGNYEWIAQHSEGLVFDGTSRVRPDLPKKGLWRVAWARDGKTLAVARENQTVGLWEPDQNKWGPSLAIPSGPVTALAWDPTGAGLATAVSRAGKENPLEVPTTGVADPATIQRITALLKRQPTWLNTHVWDVKRREAVLRKLSELSQFDNAALQKAVTALRESIRSPGVPDGKQEWEALYALYDVKALSRYLFNAPPPEDPRNTYQTPLWPFFAEGDGRLDLSGQVFLGGGFPRDYLGFGAEFDAYAWVYGRRPRAGWAAPLPQ